MATPDEGIKKVTVSLKDLQPMTEKEKYFIRYRVVYSDSSQQSAWSSKYEVLGKSVVAISGTDEIGIWLSSDDNAITATWKVPAEISGKNFDIWSRWSYTDSLEASMDDWQYETTTSEQKVTLAIPFNIANTKAKFVQILVQLETVPRIALVSSGATIALSPITTTRNIMDGGTP